MAWGLCLSLSLSLILHLQVTRVVKYVYSAHTWTDTHTHTARTCDMHDTEYITPSRGQTWFVALCRFLSGPSISLLRNELRFLHN